MYLRNTSRVLMKNRNEDTKNAMTLASSQGGVWRWCERAPPTGRVYCTVGKHESKIRLRAVAGRGCGRDGKSQSAVCTHAAAAGYWRNTAITTVESSVTSVSGGWTDEWGKLPGTAGRMRMPPHTGRHIRRSHLPFVGPPDKSARKCFGTVWLNDSFLRQSRWIV